MNETQRLEALAKGNRIRREKARIKERLRHAPNARTALAWCVKYMADPPYCLWNTQVEKLMLSCRKVGPARVAKYLQQTNIQVGTKIGDLSDRQIESLRDLLGEKDQPEGTDEET